MPRSCTHLYAHFVWATYDREPLITENYEPAIYKCIAQKCRELKCVPLAIGGISDHIHVLVRLAGVVSAAQLAKNMKGSSSHLMTQVLNVEHGFRWQGTYGSYSLAETQIRSVAEYVEHQKEHHANNDLWPALERCFENEDSDEPEF